MSFAAIPTRSNGSRVVREWFNTLATAGAALEALFGTFTAWTSFTITNGGSGAITGLTLGTTIRSAVIDIHIYRSFTGTVADYCQRVQLHARRTTTDGGWVLDVVTQSGDAEAVSFTINASTGAISYAADTKAGVAATSTLMFKYEGIGT